MGNYLLNIYFMFLTIHKILIYQFLLPWICCQLMYCKVAWWRPTIKFCWFVFWLVWYHCSLNDLKCDEELLLCMASSCSSYKLHHVVEKFGFWGWYGYIDWTSFLFIYCKILFVCLLVPLCIFVPFCSTGFVCVLIKLLFIK